MERKLKHKFGTLQDKNDIEELQARKKEYNLLQSFSKSRRSISCI